MSRIITDLSSKVKNNYFVKEKYEAGIILSSFEVKAIRNFNCIITNSYAIFKNLECWIVNFIINIPTFLSKDKYLDIKKNKKLLLHKKELRILSNLLKMKGMTLIPSKVYWKNTFIKIELCLALGKKHSDKKAFLKKKEKLFLSDYQIN